MIEEIALSLIAGGGIGYILSTFRRDRATKTVVEMYKNALEDSRAIIRNLKRQQYQYENPPALPEGSDISELIKTMGIKLPAWAKPLLNTVYDRYQNDEEFKKKIDEYIKQFMQKGGKKDEGQLQLSW